MSIEATLGAWADARRTQGDRVALPPEAYTSEAMAKLERETVFASGWVVVGHVSELKKPGDYLTFDLAGHPVLVARGRDGEIRAFSNVCAHRSAVIASGSGNTTVFACPYHAWTYDLTGKLMGAPHMDRAALGDIGLKGLRSEIWQGLVFVNLDKDAESLAPALAALAERIAPLRLDKHEVVLCEDMRFDCNWKVLVENFCESYHVFCVHKATLEDTTPTVTIENLEGGPGFNHHLMRTNADYAIEPARRRGVAEADVTAGHLICIYPALAFAFDGGSALWLSVMPDGPESLRVRMWQALYPEGNEPIDAAHISAANDAVHAFMAEDKGVIEGVQRGLAAGTGNRAPLHPWEATNWEFACRLLERMGIEAPPA